MSDTCSKHCGIELYLESYMSACVGRLFESTAASSIAKDMATNGMMCGNWWGWSCTSFGTSIACPCTWPRMGSMLAGNNTFQI